ncbi:uncharacterized protein K489DRAFT_380111 [Dissoconium aciculare CBS 342.82]|uniref:Uncharacterized protein n=1 Tax=Dissoconium aciculare CBS 342.82 TaxID=1314786 RepID=A0A6J3M4A7_9PEZI|nr:uncharacterized protein K489DRAFT_380111 [Dissoconium aciculare CBS 342.82]KAF1822738.1 hypothetical protein K489DRAFT_380111 [Dissoconium aciculare CBS 342.82]
MLASGLLFCCFAVAPTAGLFLRPGAHPIQHLQQPEWKKKFSTTASELRRHSSKLWDPVVTSEIIRYRKSNVRPGRRRCPKCRVWAGRGPRLVSVKRTDARNPKPKPNNDLQAPRTGTSMIMSEQWNYRLSFVCRPPAPSRMSVGGDTPWVFPLHCSRAWVFSCLPAASMCALFSSLFMSAIG